MGDRRCWIIFVLGRRDAKRVAICPFCFSDRTEWLTSNGKGKIYSFSIDRRALERPDLLAGRTPRTINMSTIGPALLNRDAPIDALIVYNSNPLAVAPDSTRVVRGFAREDLFTVVLEHFQTDTADYADILLPATTQLEHLDVVKPYGHYYMMANNPAIAPLGEAVSASRATDALSRKGPRIGARVWVRHRGR